MGRAVHVSLRISCDAPKVGSEVHSFAVWDGKPSILVIILSGQPQWTYKDVYDQIRVYLTNVLRNTTTGWTIHWYNGGRQSVKMSQELIDQQVSTYTSYLENESWQAVASLLRVRVVIINSTSTDCFSSACVYIPEPDVTPTDTLFVANWFPQERSACHYMRIVVPSTSEAWAACEQRLAAEQRRRTENRSPVACLDLRDDVSDQPEGDGMTPRMSAVVDTCVQHRHEPAPILDPGNPLEPPAKRQTTTPLHSGSGPNDKGKRPTQLFGGCHIRLT
jgi:hypothetical protein